MDEEEDTGTLEREVARIHRARRRGLYVGLGTAALTSVLLFVWPFHADRVRGFLRGEATLDGTPVYAPEHPMSEYAVGEIDFDRVHRELIPRWTVALAQAATSTTPYWDDRADARFEELAHEVEPDPNLSDLMAWTHDAVRHDPVGRARRLDYWLWSYNHYLDDSGVPWRLEASMFLREHGAVLVTRSYEVLSDARASSGERLRLIRRADRMSNVEGWLGRTGQHGDGAMVLMRRVLHFTVRHVWPSLDPALDARRPARERSWAPMIRGEVEAALDHETYRLLRESASDQQVLIEVAAEIEGREACGSRFRIYDLPYNGLSRRSIRALELAVARSEHETECPEVTLEEAASIVGASERLATTDELEDAIERLTMLVARSVAAHELRHAADGDDHDAIDCPGCPDGLDGLARAEVSAYLAAMATEGLGYLALFQACATPVGRGVQGAARQAVLDALLPFGCEGPTLWALYQLAAEIEADLFGERARISLPTLPDRIQLLPRPRLAERLSRGTALPSGWGVAITREGTTH